MVGIAMMLVALGLLAIVDPFCTEGRGKEIAIFLPGTLLDLDNSNSIIFCLASAGLPSFLGGIGHILVTNRFAKAGKVEGHRVVALVRLDIIDGVVVAVVGIRVVDTLGSIQGFSATSPYIASCLFVDFCFSSFFF